MSTLPPCPKCNCEYTYEDRNLYVCPECAHEWDPHAAAAADAREDKDTEAWLCVAEKHLKAAETTDPTCPYHKDARKEFDKVLAERRAASRPWAAMGR